MTDQLALAASSQLDAVDRSLTVSPSGSMVAAELTISEDFETDVADLWDAVTTGERIARWFAPVHGDLRLGGSYQVEGNAGGVIESCDPPHQYTATWVMGEGMSRITVTVADLGQGRSRFTLAHSAEVEQAFWDMYGPGAVGVGWDLGVLGLSLYLATGVGRPEDADAWATTEPARKFITGSGRRWAEAAIAAGTEAEAAHAAELNTNAFYLGTA
ncbi:MAG: SRPBCC domain-containing protein [Propionibacteriaceae bacterium]|nr:SRPBCC domain-containing protein [Propionibacteriaceae bacterium]